MGKFAYNNTKNTIIGHAIFYLNYSFHPQNFYKKDVNLYSQLKSANELAIELKELIIV